MKIIRGIGVAVLLGLTTLQTFAIEGLQVSVQCSNVCLSWPSVEGEIYVVEYRQTLTDTNGWQMLTADLAAETGTNRTVFVHTNIIQNPSCDCASGNSLAMNGSRSFLAGAMAAPPMPVPMAIPANESGRGVPLALYPPGFNLTGFLIYDPATGETVSGTGYTISYRSALNGSMNAEDGTGMSPTPMGGPVPDGGSGGSETEPETGFYQVARLGVHIVGLDNFTNGCVTNTITMPFEAANEIGSLNNMVVLVDGTRYRGADPVVAPGINGRITLDTSFLENGEHTVQVVASWLNPDLTDVNNHNFTRYSDPFTLSVTNVIYYPDWDDEIGELGFAYYAFKTTCTNADWQIDIYDVSNNLARTLMGHTDDGMVETNWDLVDLHGVARATNDDDGEFVATITVGDPVTKVTKPRKKQITYPDHGRWAIAYQDKFGNMASSNAYQSAIYDFGSIGAANGGAVTAFPTPGHPEYGQTFPMRYRYTNCPTPPTGMQIIADENALMDLLTNNINRNFYFNGHGNAEGIATIESQRISIALQNKHYYRFVFLDACSTANGGLPAAFGINLNSTQPLSYFQKHGMRPRTFLGYNKDVYFGQNGNFYDPDTGQYYPSLVPDRVIYFLTNFEFYWYFNYDITTALYNAGNDTPDLRAGWEDGHGQDLMLYGYDGLYIDQYNYLSDWQN